MTYEFLCNEFDSKNNTKYYFHRANTFDPQKCQTEYFTHIYLTKEVRLRKCGYAKYSFHWAVWNAWWESWRFAWTDCTWNFNEFWNEPTVGGSEWNDLSSCHWCLEGERFVTFERSMETRMKFVRVAQFLRRKKFDERNNLKRCNFFLSLIPLKTKRAKYPKFNVRWSKFKYGETYIENNTCKH